MTQRTYPYAKLLRLDKPMWTALLKQCKVEQIDATQFIRRAIQRDLTRRK